MKESKVTERILKPQLFEFNDLKAARLQIHPNFHENFEIVFKGKIL
jgi:hypothetical protein